MKSKEASVFLLRVFHPIVSDFSKELEFKANDCFDGAGEELWRASAREDFDRHFAERIAALIERHKAIFEKRKSDTSAMRWAKQLTEAAVTIDPEDTSIGMPGTCPVCGSEAAISFCFNYESRHLPVEQRGGYVNGMNCNYCDLSLNENDWDEIDYFKIDQQSWQF